MSYPIYYGNSYQKGYGLGGIFRRMFNFVLPLLKTHALPVIKSGAQTLGNEAVRTASNIASDAIMGKNIEESAKSHASMAVENLKNKAKESLQIGKGRKRKTIKRNKKEKFRRVQDIFDKI